MDWLFPSSEERLIPSRSMPTPTAATAPHSSRLSRSLSKQTAKRTKMTTPELMVVWMMLSGAIFKAQR